MAPKLIIRGIIDADTQAGSSNGKIIVLEATQNLSASELTDNFGFIVESNGTHTNSDYTTPEYIFSHYLTYGGPWFINDPNFEARLAANAAADVYDYQAGTSQDGTGGSGLLAGQKLWLIRAANLTLLAAKDSLGGGNTLREAILADMASSGAGRPGGLLELSASSIISGNGNDTVILYEKSTATGTWDQIDIAGVKGSAPSQSADPTWHHEDGFMWRTNSDPMDGTFILNNWIVESDEATGTVGAAVPFNGNKNWQALLGTHNLFCFHADTMVQGRRIAEIRAGDVVETTQGPRKVKQMVATPAFGTQPFVVVPKGALGGVAPTEDLKVTPGHIMAMGGMLVDASELVGKVPGVFQVALPASAYHFVFAGNERVNVAGIEHTTVHPMQAANMWNPELEMAVYPKVTLGALCA